MELSFGFGDKLSISAKSLLAINSISISSMVKLLMLNLKAQ